MGRSVLSDRPSPIGRVSRVSTRLRRLGVYELAERIALSHGVDLVDVLGRRRHSELIPARHELWTVLRHSLDLSYPALGRVFEVDHTTVLSAVHDRESELAAEYA